MASFTLSAIIQNFTKIALLSLSHSLSLCLFVTTTKSGSNFQNTKKRRAALNQLCICKIYKMFLIEDLFGILIRNMYELSKKNISVEVPHLL